MGPLGPNLRKGVSTSSWTGSVAAPPLDPCHCLLAVALRFVRLSPRLTSPSPPRRPPRPPRARHCPRPAPPQALRWSGRRRSTSCCCRADERGDGLVRAPPSPLPRLANSPWSCFCCCGGCFPPLLLVLPLPSPPPPPLLLLLLLLLLLVLLLLLLLLLLLHCCSFCSPSPPGEGSRKALELDNGASQPRPPQGASTSTSRSLTVRRPPAPRLPDLVSSAATAAWSSWFLLLLRRHRRRC
jgi:hypothetical protein